jgi:predicted CXXCH cytochrome family protein
MSITRVAFAVFLIAVVTAFVVIVCAAGVAYAAGPEPQQQPDCATCHSEVAKAWEGGKHAEKGVACVVCHKPGSNAHPGSPIGVDKSADLCGTCHSAAFKEWQASGHGRVNVACSSCHDMHSAALKFVTPTDLCAGCHKERSSPTNMPMGSATNACIGCHMNSAAPNANAGSTPPSNHSFVMGADACQRCHKDSAHAAHQIVSTAAPQPGTDKPVQQPVPTATVAAASVTSNSVSAWPNIVGGVIGGLLLGFISAVVVIRR